MNLIARISGQFDESARLTLATAEALAAPIADAVGCLVGVLANDCKIIACGAGQSAGDAIHFAGLMNGRFERERPELAAIALNAGEALFASVAAGYGPDAVYARQVRALGQPGDALLAISAGGDDAALIAAVDAARERSMPVVALTGEDGGALARRLAEGDVHLVVASDRAARIIEVHRLIIHCLCDGIDSALLGEQD